MAKQSREELIQELQNISNEYDLHPVEIRNIFNQTILDVNKLPRNEYISFYNDEGQFYLYSIVERKIQKKNISIAMFRKFINKFIDNVQEKAYFATVDNAITATSKKDFVKLELVEVTRKLLYYKINDKNSPFKNITFKYQPIRNEKTYLVEHGDRWFDARKLFSNKEEFVKKNIRNSYTVMKCYPFSSYSAVVIFEDIAQKIKKTSNGIIKLSVVAIDEKKKVIIVASSIFITKELFSYIERKIYKETFFRITIEK